MAIGKRCLQICYNWQNDLFLPKFFPVSSRRNTQRPEQQWRLGIPLSNSNGRACAGCGFPKCGCSAWATVRRQSTLSHRDLPCAPPRHFQNLKGISTKLCWDQSSDIVDSFAFVRVQVAHNLVLEQIKDQNITTRRRYNRKTDLQWIEFVTRGQVKVE